MTTPSNTPKRTLIPILILIASASAITYVQLNESIEGNYRALLTIPIILATLLLLALWLVTLSGLRHGLRWRIVGAGFLCLVILGFAVGLLTRRDGSYSGAGMPRLVWRWTPIHTLPPLNVTAPTINMAVILKPSPDDFPQFLGPDRDNQIRGVHLGRDWSKNPPALLWRHPVGLGWSGFSVVGNAAITMEQRGDQESTICYNLTTGEPIWVHANKAYLVEREGGDGPRATPTIFGGHVYTHGGLGILDCLDAETGKLIWTQSTLKEPLTQRLRYGQTASPLIVDDKVIVTGGHAPKDHDPIPSVLAFNKETGAPAWQFTGDAASYASPSVVMLAGVRQILQVHQNGIAGHDIADGHLLWEYSWSPGFWPKNSQAVAIDGDKVYCSTGYSIGSVLLQIHGSTVQSASELWHTPIMKTELSNVVVGGGYAYGLDDGHLICQDLSTGKRVWRRADPYGHGQIFQAGDVLIAQSESGDVSLLDVSPAGATELGSFPALTGSRTCWNPPALAGHLLVIRNDREAACYRLP